MERNLREEIKELLKNEVAQRHSYFQLKYFLIGKEPTYQSKMWQCLRELKTRYDSLEAIDLEREEVKDKIEWLDISVLRSERQAGDELDAREAGIRARQLQRQKRALEKNLVDLDERERWLREESLFFVETFKNIEKIEPLRPFDDLEAQRQYWNERLTTKANLKMLTQNTVDSELVETIISLPDDLPIKKHTLRNLNLKQEQTLKQLEEVAKKLQLKPDKEN